MNLPPSHLAVLEAMARPDARPPTGPDTPGAAIHHRLPSMSSRCAAEILRELNFLGLINIPRVRRASPSAAMANLRQWITEKGWEVLGIETIAPTTHLREPGTRKDAL